MKLFSMDGKFLNIFNRITDLVVLNLLWILCCLPIFTIGAATSALYQVTLQMAEDRESYIAQSFFHAFLENFKQATASWLICLAAIVVLLADTYVVSHFFTGMHITYVVLFFILSFLLFCVMLYMFPVIAYFKNSLKKIFINSFRLAFGNLATTLQLFLLSLLPALVLVLFQSMPVLGSFLILVIVPSATAFFQSVLLSHLFKKIPVNPSENFS